MPDREKVIKGLEGIKNHFHACLEKFGRTALPFEEYENAATCAIALLKEQDAIEPRRDANCVRMFRCGACGEYVGFIDSDPGDPNEQDNYCRNCGRAVKWE